MSGIKIKTQAAAPIRVGELKIQPVSQSIHWIRKNYGLVWNRPYAVRVDDGQTVRQIPIQDRTRIYLAILWGLTALFGMIFLSSKSGKRSKK